MTMDILPQIFQAFGYLLLLVILVLLWRETLRRSEARLFWGLLAAAWTMNLLGNIAWIVHDLTTGTELNEMSIVDLFFVLHYVLVGCALWLYPEPLSARAGFWIAGTMLAAVVVDWLVYFKPATALRGGDWIDFLTLIAYMLLDAGLIVLAWLRVRRTRGPTWGRLAFLLFCAMISYGIANTINLTEYVFSLTGTGGILQNLLWMLTDVFLLVMIVGKEKRTLDKGITYAEQN